MRRLNVLVAHSHQYFHLFGCAGKRLTDDAVAVVVAIPAIPEASESVNHSFRPKLVKTTGMQTEWRLGGVMARKRRRCLLTDELRIILGEFV